MQCRLPEVLGGRLEQARRRPLLDRRQQRGQRGGGAQTHRWVLGRWVGSTQPAQARAPPAPPTCSMPHAAAPLTHHGRPRHGISQALLPPLAADWQDRRGVAAGQGPRFGGWGEGVGGRGEGQLQGVVFEGVCMERAAVAAWHTRWLCCCTAGAAVELSSHPGVVTPSFLLRSRRAHARGSYQACGR